MHAIILAAGTSSRMGAPKLHLAWGDGTVLDQTIQNVTAVTQNVLVVTGAYAEQTRTIAAAYPVTIVHNEQYTEGEMISSLQAALTALQEPDDFFVMLGDMPLIDAHTIAEIVAFWEVHGGIVVPTFAGKRGHPVVFSAEFIPQLLALGWDQTPRTVVEANKARLNLFKIDDPAILIDLDTPELYTRWRQESVSATKFSPT